MDEQIPLNFDNKPDKFENLLSRLQELKWAKHDAERTGDMTYANELQTEIDELQEKLNKIESEQENGTLQSEIPLTENDFHPHSVTGTITKITPQVHIAEMRKLLREDKD